MRAERTAVVRSRPSAGAPSPRALPTRALPTRALLGAAALLAATAGGALLSHLQPGFAAAATASIGRAERTLGTGGLPVAFAAQLAMALCGILPAATGAIAAGMVYGTAVGFLVCAPATVLGAVIAFAASRSLFRAAATRLLARRRRLLQLDALIARDGWRLVCLLRVSPVMPFAATSYALGLTGLGFRPYLLGTLASLPPLLLYTLLGALAANGLHALRGANAGTDATVLHLSLLALAIGATVLLALRLGHIIGRVLRLEPPSGPSPDRVAG